MLDIYFKQLNRCLKSQGNGLAHIIVDIQRYQKNLNKLAADFPQHCKPRLVVKSLANLSLITQASQMLNTQAFMLFHLLHIKPILDAYPEADILLGKPMPIQALTYAHQQQLFNVMQVQWLVDSVARLMQYLEFAQQHQLELKINLEIDVGLHRGGLNDMTAVRLALGKIKAHPQQLKLSGMMGYDAHVAKLPQPFFSSEKSYQKSQQIYQQYVECIKDIFPEIDLNTLTLNGAGSSTIYRHFKQTVCNDLAFGSLLLKPADFEINALADFEPALWIASPVLKILDRVQLPGLEGLSQIQNVQAMCIYGGYWRGGWVSPTGAKPHVLYGRSSNQELLQLTKPSQINVDDYAFFRPAQSEAVIPQFEHSYFYDGKTLEPHLNLRE